MYKARPFGLIHVPTYKLQKVVYYIKTSNEDEI